MTYMRFFLLASICLFTYRITLASQQKDSLDFTLYFKVGKADIERDFCGNAFTLDRIVFEINRLQREGMLHKLHFSAGTSPEGGLELNRRLSQKRLWHLYGYISSQVEVADSLCELSSTGIDWHRLSRLVNESDVGYKKQVNELLETHSHYKERCISLMKITGGCAWKEMTRLFFPTLRAGRLVLFFDTPSMLQPEVPASRLIVPEANPELVAVRSGSDLPVQPADRRSFFLAVKTNLLYDAALIPNVSAEFYLKDNWTIGAGWMYAWWKNDSHNRYWRIYGGEIDVRKYMGRAAAGRPFTGHHVGAYLQYLTYDFELGGRGYIGGKPGGTLWDKAGKGAGIAYGYSLPIGNRLNMDFGIGAGVFWGTCYEYKPSGDGYIWDRTRNFCWIGPTRLEVTLAWIVGKGAFNKK